MSIHSEFMAEIDKIQKQFDADCKKISAAFDANCKASSDRLDAEIRQTERETEAIKKQIIDQGIADLTESQGLEGVQAAFKAGRSGMTWTSWLMSKRA